MKKKNNAVFIVNSPFQALSSISVVKQNKFDSLAFYVINGEGSFEKTTALLKQYGFHYIVIDRLLHWFSLIKRVSFMGHFQTVYVGDYFSIKEYIIAMAASSLRANVVYLDDGNSTLSIAPPVSRKRYYSVKNRLAWCVFGGIAWLKRLRFSFCSIYDIEGKVKYPVKTNDLSCLINTNLAKPKIGYYIIGTNIRDSKIRNHTYIDYLNKVISFLRKSDENETIYYCPHRRNPETYSEFLEMNNIKIFNTEISVEVDFCSKGINPKIIIGFGSTALITLRSIFSETEVVNCRIDFKNEKQNIAYKSIEKYMQTYHIHTLE